MIYRIWGKFCVWCKKPLAYEDLEIEHLVPKGLKGKELAQVLEQYGLDPSFDVHSLPNLAPSCGNCNRSKGSRPVGAVPIIVTMLSRSATQAAKVAKRAAAFNRQRELAEAIAVIETIAASKTPTETKILADLAAWLQQPNRTAYSCYEPDPPKLKRSRRMLGKGAYSNEQRMLLLLRQWMQDSPSESLDVVSDTFDGGDQRAERASIQGINFLAFAEELGDFLASVTFSVEYMFVTEDVSDLANTDHTVDLWITLDQSKRAVVGVVPDLHDTLESCASYRTYVAGPRSRDRRTP